MYQYLGTFFHVDVDSAVMRIEKNILAVKKNDGWLAEDTIKVRQTVVKMTWCVSL